MMLLWVLLALVVVGLGYVRLAPASPERWHVTPQFDADRDLTGGVLRVVPDAAGALPKIDAILRTTPRTKVLAGSVQEGMVTYVTRSRVIGFPDYTTILQDGDTLKIHARLRFGRSDLGVNRARVEGWLTELARIRAKSQG